jgi:hypothetical protein
MSSDPSAPKYDPDKDPKYDYTEDWKGAVYPKEIQDEMEEILKDVPPGKAVFAEYENARYVASYYRMMDELNRKRREQLLQNLQHPTKRQQNPLEWKASFHERGYISNLGFVSAPLAAAGFAACIYILRFLRK